MLATDVAEVAAEAGAVDGRGGKRGVWGDEYTMLIWATLMASIMVMPSPTLSTTNSNPLSMYNKMSGRNHSNATMVAPREPLVYRCPICMLAFLKSDNSGESAVLQFFKY